MSDYYVSWRCRLRLRLEEFGADGDFARVARQRTIQTQLKGSGTKDNRAPLDAIRYTDPVTGVARYILGPRGTSVVNGELIGGPVDQVSSDTFDHDIVPFTADLGRNGIRQADTLKMQIRFVDMPVDPRCIRVCGVLFYLGTVRADDFADAMLRNTAVRLPDEWTDERGRRRSNLRFKGWVDKWSVTWPDDEEATIDLDCRDNTQLLLDQIMPPQLALDNIESTPIDQAVANLLTQFPQMAGLSVEYRPTNVTAPTLTSSLAKTAHIKNQGPAAGKDGGATQASAQSKLSVWDYLTDVVGAMGHVLFLDGDVIAIQQPRTLVSGNFESRSSDPYKSRIIEGVEIPRRRIIYGHNLTELKVTRNYAKSQPQNIEVRSYDPRNKTTLIARFPEKPEERITQPGLGDEQNAEQKWLILRVKPGVVSPSQLRIVAQTVYESMGRNELSVSAQTIDLASFGGGNADPDLLDMQPGDAVDIFVRRDDPRAGEIQTLAQVEGAMLNEALAQRFLERLDFSPEFARAYAATYSRAGFQSTFRMRSCGFSCDTDKGVEVHLDMINYMEVRADKVLSPDTPGAVPEPAIQATVPSTSTAAARAGADDVLLKAIEANKGVSLQ